MKIVERSSRCTRALQPKCRLRLWVTLLMFSALLLTQSSCVLTTETIYVHWVYDSYICRATLVDTNTGERRLVASNVLGLSAPGAPARSFFNRDWDGNGTNDGNDALLDWRRYIANSVLTSSTFAGQTWCNRPAEMSCTRSVRISFLTNPPALPDRALTDCGAASGSRLEVTAPGLTPDNQFTFPDTAVGEATAPITFTVTNQGMVPLRVNGADFVTGADAPDFIRSVDGCLPTPDERAQGRGHLLGAGGVCTFQVEFRPQHRDGIAECHSTSVNESCRRRATFFVTGEVDTSRSVLTPVNVDLSGRAIGGGIVTEPAEICFSTAPALGSCTPTERLRIRNNSTGPLTLTSARLTRAGNRFDAPMPFLMPFPLPRDLYIDVQVSFCNVANDLTDGEFTINSSSPSNPTTVIRLVNPLNRRCP